MFGNLSTMSSKLLQNLLLTFLLSLLLTGFLYAVWFNLKPRGFEEGQAMTLLFVVGDIFQNIILTLSALPVFFAHVGISQVEQVTSGQHCTLPAVVVLPTNNRCTTAQ